MRIQCDTLKYAKLLGKKGLESEAAEGVMSTLTQIEIFNLYSKHEVDSMLSETVEKVFAKQDLKLAEQRREFDVRMRDTAKYHDAQLSEQRAELSEQRRELLASRRWTIGTVITVGLSLAAYLSALIHFNH
jgi:hypothetical protein